MVPMAVQTRLGQTIVLGNSVSLLVWPRRGGPQDQPYPELLSSMGWSVRNASKQGVTVGDVYCYLEDEVLSKSPESIVMQFGIVEATYRTRPRALHQAFSNNNWCNSIINMPYRSIGVKKLYRTIGQFYRLVERLLFAIGLKWRYMSPDDFEDAIRGIIGKCRAQSSAKVFLLVGIPPVGPELERKAPGTAHSTAVYNEVMQKIAAEAPDIQFICLERLFAQLPIELAVADDIHLTAEGHKLLALAIHNITLQILSYDPDAIAKKMLANSTITP